MKKTKIFVRGYSTNFEVDVMKKEYLSIEESEKHIRKDIIDTAYIRKIQHIKDDDEIEKEIINENYKDPSLVVKGDVKQFLKQTNENSTNNETEKRENQETKESGEGTQSEREITQ